MQFFHRGRNLLRSHEAVVIDAVSDALPPAARDLLSQQIAHLRKVQRHQDQREVNFYAGRRGAPGWPEACLFPNRTTELKLASVGLKGANGRLGTAEIWAVRGHVFQIRFRPSPKEMGKLAAVRATRARVHADPLTPANGASTAALIERIPEPFRAELEGLWSSSHPGPLFGRDEIYAFDHDDGRYVMLAQLPDTTFVAVRLDPAETAVCRFEPSAEMVRTYLTIALAVEGDS